MAGKRVNIAKGKPETFVQCQMGQDWRQSSVYFLEGETNLL